MEEQFLKFAKTKLDDDAYLFELVQAIVKEALAFYYQEDRKELHDKIYAKLERGTREYGNPIYPLDKLDKEIKEEMIDLIGWSLVKKFNERKRNTTK